MEDSFLLALIWAGITICGLILYFLFRNARKIKWSEWALAHQPPANGAPAKLTLTWWIVGIGSILALWFMFSLQSPTATLMPPPGRESLSDRVERECQTEFGTRGKMAVQNCQIEVLGRHIAKDRQEKLDAIERRSR